VRWHGVRLDQPDWSGSSRTLAYTLTGAGDDVPIHIIINAHTAALVFELPRPAPGRSWRRAVDTSLPSPEDLAPVGEEPTWSSDGYEVAARSVVVLVERLGAS
jgi:glycogen operon protein